MRSATAPDVKPPRPGSLVLEKELEASETRPSHLMVSADTEYLEKLSKYLQEKKIVPRLQQQAKITQEG